MLANVVRTFCFSKWPMSLVHSQTPLLFEDVRLTQNWDILNLEVTEQRTPFSPSFIKDPASWGILVPVPLQCVIHKFQIGHISTTCPLQTGGAEHVKIMSALLYNDLFTFVSKDKFYKGRNVLKQEEKKKFHKQIKWIWNSQLGPDTGTLLSFKRVTFQMEPLISSPLAILFPFKVCVGQGLGCGLLVLIHTLLAGPWVRQTRHIEIHVLKPSLFPH